MSISEPIFICLCSVMFAAATKFRGLRAKLNFPDRYPPSSSAGSPSSTIVAPSSQSVPAVHASRSSAVTAAPSLSQAPYPSSSMQVSQAWTQGAAIESQQFSRQGTEMPGHWPARNIPEGVASASIPYNVPSLQSSLMTTTVSQEYHRYMQQESDASYFNPGLGQQGSISSSQARQVQGLWSSRQEQSGMPGPPPTLALPQPWQQANPNYEYASTLQPPLTVANQNFGQEIQGSYRPQPYLPAGASLTYLAGVSYQRQLQFSVGEPSNPGSVSAASSGLSSGYHEELSLEQIFPEGWSPGAEPSPGTREEILSHMLSWPGNQDDQPPPQ